jgi:alpha-N-arabinofuranosidase
MKRTSYLYLIFLWLFSVAIWAQPVLSEYKNPIIPGFNPDPSICRTGNDYYLVTSSFEYFPGVPVYHSTDMVNWQQIGHCLTRDTQLPVQKCPASGGIWAPTIRYHEGVFYMVTTNVSNKGNFYVTSKDPSGEWSEPFWVDQGGIDPTIYWDEDGKSYFISTGHTSSNGTYKDGIVLSEINLKTGKRITEPIVIWQGTGGRYPEGPHIYKKDGYYYLMISEGGTEYGHMVTIARSRQIYGPYESCPANPILTHINKITQSNPIQGTGHADMVQDTKGDWWMVCLAFRAFNGQHHTLGRETFLAPVRWDTNSWPVVNGNGTISLNMNVERTLSPQKELAFKRDEFDADQLGLEWNYLRNPFRQNYSLIEKPGNLILATTEVGLDQADSPSFVGRRQQHFNFEAITELAFTPEGDSEEAGLTVLMNDRHHYKLSITRLKGNRVIQISNKLGVMNFTTGKVATLKPGNVKLKIVGTPDFYTFFYSQGNEPFKELGKCNSYFLSSETAGGFTGVYVGLFATSNGQKTRSKVTFNWFDYQPVEKN